MNHPQLTRAVHSVLRLSVLGLAILFGQSQSVYAQWATNGNNINNTNTGNVGIGTTNPQAKVEIHHSSATTDPANLTWADLPLFVRNTNNTNGNLSVISFGDAAGWGNVHIGVTHTNQTAHTADLYFSTRNAGVFGEKVRIKNDGKVGFGISSPSAPMQLNSAAAGFSTIGQFLITDSADTNRNLRFGYDSSLESGWIQASKIGTSYRPLLLNPNLGNVGIGLTNPGTTLDVSGNILTVGSEIGLTTRGNNTIKINRFAIPPYTAGNLLFSVIAGATTNTDNIVGVGGAAGGLAAATVIVFHTAANTNTDTGPERMRITSAGNVGIGTTAPTEKLHVQGNGKVTGNLTVDGNLAAKYQDVAEWVPAAKALPPGTVVALNRTQSNFVEASTKAYDTRVAGVISEKPGIALGESGDNKVLVATTGRVRMKVDATNGPIEIGDLLVTSDKEGVAMKSMPINVGGVEIHRPGTLIGKALEPLAKGHGEILVLLSLQ